jgi:hypothetical protein
MQGGVGRDGGRGDAVAHQHLFCARLDMAVDNAQGGRDLVVSEVRTQFGVVGEGGTGEGWRGEGGGGRVEGVRRCNTPAPVLGTPGYGRGWCTKGQGLGLE